MNWVAISPPERVLEARDVVAELLDEAGIQEPPVDLKEVAAARGITRIRHARLKSAYGLLKSGPNGHTVTINNRYMNRARFTLAHEIAHTLVEHFEYGGDDVPLAHRKPRRADGVESFCDELAAEILFPYRMFRDQIAEGPVGIDEVLRLAKLFDGSVMATAKRVGDLADAPVQVISWVRQDEDTLRAGQRSGRDFLTTRGASPFRALNDSGSPAVRAFHSGHRERGVEVPLPDKPWNAFECEAQRFSGSRDGYVLSVIKPAKLAS